ncbi:hypothetical protein GCM10007390_23460 [Persicitalea jodogahamensis]|uniref:Thioredoxin domain-containing protein n=2 Tax=Persicitalea jodogahamensis TaxID=402147 RepID=A0A8J3D407_9BACT|nr:hypothetical protein GCM10007390_23460 [Persicitalea jodogahamensis]
MDENTIIYDEATGRRITIQEFGQINHDTPRDFRLDPEINEYGKPAYYVLKKNSEEERETGRINPYKDRKRPEIGQPLPPFVMEGADGKTYRLEDLKGSYVLLSFWVKLSKPFFQEDESTKDIMALLKKAQANRAKVVSLGITLDSQEESLAAMDEYSLGFIPVPNARGFTRKYNMPNPGSFLLIDPNGVLLEIIDRGSPLKLEKYFKK